MSKQVFPHIEIEGKVLYQIACKWCKRAHDWKIYSDGSSFMAVCKCGHGVAIRGEILKNEPVAVYPLGYFL